MELFCDLFLFTMTNNTSDVIISIQPRGGKETLILKATPYMELS